mgnify:CR=1 FL=1
MKSKICGISDLEILKFLTNHLCAPEFIGFIVNFPKSKRFVDSNKLKELLKVNKRNSKYVAVLVKPDEKILDEIKHLPFDYYQIYDCKPNEIEKIKKNYNKKIILALTIQNSKDIEKFKLYENYADIFLFDGKGYEKSISFNHSLLNKFKFNKEVMLAGNIQINDNLENYKKIADIIDISGGVETSGLKDISKLEIFLQNIKKIKNET